ncbi:hypothetical protein [Streptomyces sp. HPF1205]|uniref:hypothetical protein n=1 Tax=Streptomyces sp. HPF1205 TaxID=2873262 RepID=UPI001CECA137|nr:hypothetical protein [Streptomyces sp. HPF1205]
MDQNGINAIFTAAAGATDWQRTDLGLSTKVRYAGSEWTVQLPPDSGRACIPGVLGDGCEMSACVVATWLQTMPIVEAAMSATRLL